MKMKRLSVGSMFRPRQGRSRTRPTGCASPQNPSFRPVRTAAEERLVAGTGEIKSSKTDATTIESAFAKTKADWISAYLTPQEILDRKEQRPNGRQRERP